MPPPFRFGDWELCQYGHLSWITPLMAFLALWLFLFPAFRCSLTVSRPPTTPDAHIFVGYWQRESTELVLANLENDGNVCVSWLDRDFFDGIWKFGRGVGCLGAVTCAGCVIMDILLIFMRFPLHWFYPLMGFHILNAILSALLLMAFASYICEISFCVPGRGAYIAIVAIIFWLILAYLIYLLRKKEQELQDQYDDRDLEDLGDPEPDEERPLALPAPPKKSRPKQQPKPQPKKQPKEEPRLALPASETNSPRRAPKKSKPPPSNNHLALPDSENSSQRKAPKSKSSRRKNNDGEHLALPDSENTKKKKKKPSGDAASTSSGRKKRNP